MFREGPIVGGLAVVVIARHTPRGHGGGQTGGWARSSSEVSDEQCEASDRLCSAASSAVRLQALGPLLVRTSVSSVQPSALETRWLCVTASPSVTQRVFDVETWVPFRRRKPASPTSHRPLPSCLGSEFASVAKAKRQTSACSESKYQASPASLNSSRRISPVPPAAWTVQQGEPLRRTHRCPSPTRPHRVAVDILPSCAGWVSTRRPDARQWTPDPGTAFGTLCLGFSGIWLVMMACVMMFPVGSRPTVALYSSMTEDAHPAAAIGVCGRFC